MNNFLLLVHTYVSVFVFVSRWLVVALLFCGLFPLFTPCAKNDRQRPVLLTAANLWPCQHGRIGLLYSEFDDEGWKRRDRPVWRGRVSGTWNRKRRTDVFSEFDGRVVVQTVACIVIEMMEAISVCRKGLLLNEAWETRKGDLTEGKKSSITVLSSTVLGHSQRKSLGVDRTFADQNVSPFSVTDNYEYYIWPKSQQDHYEHNSQQHWRSTNSGI